VGLSPHKLATSRCKRLKEVTLFVWKDVLQELLMDVNKLDAIAEQVCAGPIHRYLDSNLRF
jgi:hypothetical protein